jgi:ABC-type dipeptide/oligopeptide/nickel transport system permease subunit
MRYLLTLWIVFISSLFFLGVDEFERSIAVTVVAALGLSALKGLMISSLVLLLATTLATIGTRAGMTWVRQIVSLLNNLVDSIPSLLWVLVVVVAITQPRGLVPVIAFAVVVLPSVSRTIIAEVSRVSSQDFVLAARCIGTSERRILFRHILPNSVSVLIPLSMQVLGGAIAIDGAIGLLGMGNRTDLNLGTFLVRGKEQFLFAPSLFAISLTAYVLLFSTIHFFIKKTRVDL